MLNRRSGGLQLIVGCFMLATFLSARLAIADAPRVLPEGKLPKTSGWASSKTSTATFRSRPTTKEAWEARAEQVRRRILVANGLWPMPETPANAVVHGQVDRDSYTVERVYLRKLPRILRHRQPVSTQGQERQAAGRALSARPLDRRPFHRQRFEILPSNSRRGRRAVRERRPQPLQVDVRATGPDGLRRVSLRHDRLRRQPAAFVRPGPPVCQAAARDEHARELGPVQPAGRAAPAEHHGPANLELDPRARLCSASCPTSTRRASASPARSGGGTQTFILCAHRSAAGGGVSRP